MNKLPVIFLLPVVLGLPFVGRAFFVDDHYHLLMAQGLLENPARPFDFRADDNGIDNVGWERGQPPRMVNPPGHHYVLALFWKLGGGRLWSVRCGFLLLSGLAAVFIFLLARRLLVPPEPVASLCVLTPAFWLSSYSLLIDSTMLVFFLGGLWLWIEGTKRDSPLFLTLSGLFMGFTVLTKYTGGYVGLLALAWWAFLPRPERRWKHVLYLAIPALMLAVWSLWTLDVYGAVHWWAASQRMAGWGFWTPFVAVTFFSGVLAAPLAVWRWAWARRRLFWGALLGAALFALFLRTPYGGYPAAPALLTAALFASGVLFFVLIFRPGGLWVRATDRFLLLWLALGAAQMMVAMGWVAGRYYLTLLPPVIFLSYRTVDIFYAHAPARRSRFWTLLCAGTFVLSAAMAVADAKQAETSRRIVKDTRADGLPTAIRRCFYLGDSFTDSYLKAAGWRAVFEKTQLVPGDLLLHHGVTMPRWWFRPDPGRFRVLKIYEYPWRFPLRVMDNRGAAGFYASIWGGLPFTFSREPLERYVLLEAITAGPADGST